MFTVPLCTGYGYAIGNPASDFSTTSVVTIDSSTRIISVITSDVADIMVDKIITVVAQVGGVTLSPTVSFTFKLTIYSCTAATITATPGAPPSTQTYTIADPAVVMPAFDPWTFVNSNCASSVTYDLEASVLFGVDPNAVKIDSATRVITIDSHINGADPGPNTYTVDIIAKAGGT